MNRIGERLDRETPITQAAYRKNRSTTEHVFAAKMAIDRTISSQNENLHLVMLDMSKAFDSINRKVLIEHLQKTIDLGRVTARPKFPKIYRNFCIPSTLGKRS